MAISENKVAPTLDERRKKAVAKGVSVQNPVAIRDAKGALMWDENGKEYVDFAGGIGCLNVGSAHPEVVAVVQEQAAKFFHTCFHVAIHEPYVKLAEELCRITPIEGETKAFLANSGAEAVENAIKVARSYTGRAAIIAFDYAFHGRTNMGLALTSKIHPYKAGFGPFMPEVYRIPFANSYRRPADQSLQAFEDEYVRIFQEAFDTYVNADDVAAVIVEPVQGEGGFIIPPPGYLPRIREICRSKGILFIADEIQTGFGRTGKMFAVEHYEGLDPDIMTMAKSMGGGLPISAVVGRAEIMDATEVGGLGGTFGGNPLSAVAALKVIEIMERDDLAGRARVIGDKSVAFLQALQQKYPGIGDIRAQGAMIALELVKDPQTKEPDGEVCALISQKCLAKGLLTIKAGIYNNVIRMLAPLVISDEELQRGLDMLGESVAEAMAELGR